MRETFTLGKGRGPNSKKTRERAMPTLKQLEKYGRAHVQDNKVPHMLSFRFREAKNDERIIFSWNKQHKKSVISLKPGYKLKIVSPKKVKIYFDEY